MKINLHTRGKKGTSRALNANPENFLSDPPPFSPVPCSLQMFISFSYGGVSALGRPND